MTTMRPLVTGTDGNPAEIASTDELNVGAILVNGNGSDVPLKVVGGSGQIGDFFHIQSFGGTDLFSVNFGGNASLFGALTANLSGCTGLPIATGVSGLGSGIATFLATPSSANLAAAVTNETGSGSLVFSESPAFGASIGIGGAASSTSSLFTQGNQLTGATQYAFRTQTTANENAITGFFGQASQVRTKATAFTCALGAGVKVLDGSLGAGSTLTTQIGIDVDPLTIGGTNNYGIRLQVASSATGAFNVFASGTAPNYLNGEVRIGSQTAGSGSTFNLVLGGGSTSPVLGAAAADIVSLAAVDNVAGNRELQVQPESGGLFAVGNNKFRRVPTANQDVYEWTPTVNTTDGTQTTLATIPIVASRTYLITARVAARRTGGVAGTADDGATYERRASYTTKSSTVTLLGAVQTLGTDVEDQAGWDVTLTISGSNVLVRVTGATNNNVTWFGDITVQSVGS